MPKIKSQKFWYYLPDMATAQITCHINANGDFYVPVDDFPKEVINLCLYQHKKISIGKGKRYSLSERKEGFLLDKGVADFEWVVKKIFKSAEDNFKDTNKEKVIIFKIQLQGLMQEAKLVNEDTPDEHWQQREEFSEISSFSSDRESTGIRSMWEVLFKVKSPDEDTDHFYDMDNRKVGRSRDYSDWKQIGWTQQREDWFVALDDSLKKIIRSAQQFRDANPELIEKYIDTAKGGNLLEFKLQEEKTKKVRGKNKVTVTEHTD